MAAAAEAAEPEDGNADPGEGSTAAPDGSPVEGSPLVTDGSAGPVEGSPLDSEGDAELADGELTGNAARAARKQRLEAREADRLRRVSEKAAARRALEEAREVKRKAAAARREERAARKEEERLARVAEKAAARRAKSFMSQEAPGSPADAAAARSAGGGGAVGGSDAAGASPQPAAEGGDEEDVVEDELARLNRLAQKVAQRRAQRIIERGVSDSSEAELPVVKRAAKNKKAPKEGKPKKKAQKKAALAGEGGEAKGKAKAKRPEKPKKAAKAKKAAAGAKKAAAAGGNKEAAAAKRRKKGEGGEEDEEGATSSSSSGEEEEEGSEATSSSSSSSGGSSGSHSSGASAGAKAIAKALATGQPLPKTAPPPPDASACFAWESAAVGRPVGLSSNGMMSAAVAPSQLLSPLASSQEVEQFLAMSGVDGGSAQQMRMLPPHHQRLVMERGPIFGSRNPSSVLISRIRDIEFGRVTAPPPGFGVQQQVSSSNPAIEKLIKDYSLDLSASGLLRSLPPDKQKMALSIPLTGSRNPSAVIMTQLLPVAQQARGVMPAQPPMGTSLGPTRL